MMPLAMNWQYRGVRHPSALFFVPYTTQAATIAPMYLDKNYYLYPLDVLGFILLPEIVIKA